jgi:hypothetical protein
LGKDEIFEGNIRLLVFALSLSFIVEVGMGANQGF